MLLITNNEQLTALLPNIAVTVQGETPLIDKLAPFLNASENWVNDTFLSSAIFAEIATRQANAVCIFMHTVFAFFIYSELTVSQAGLNGQSAPG